MFVLKSTYEILQKQNDEYEAALVAILAQRTASPNATVTRILDIAEKALGE